MKKPNRSKSRIAQQAPAAASSPGAVLTQLALLLAVVLLITSCAPQGEDPARSPSASGSTKTTVLKLGFNQGKDHPQYRAMVELSEELANRTEQRYTIQVYEQEQLGTQEEMLQNVSRGTVDLVFVSGPLLEQYNADFGVYNLPYVFDTAEAQINVLQDEQTNRMLYGSLAEQHNLLVLAGVHAGTRNVYSVDHPIREPSDLADLTIRVQEGQTSTGTFEALGANPVQLATSDIYPALETGEIEAAENNEAVYVQLRHSDSAKYYSYTQHAMLPDYLVASNKVLDAMPKADRAVFDELVAKAQDDINQQMPKYLSEQRAAAKADVVEFSDADTAAFKRATTDYVTEFVAESPQRESLYQAILDANAGRLTASSPAKPASASQGQDDSGINSPAASSSGEAGSSSSTP